MLSSISFIIAGFAAVYLGYSFAKWSTHTENRLAALEGKTLSHGARIVNHGDRLDRLDAHPWLREPERLRTVSVTRDELEHLADCSLNRGEMHCDCMNPKGAA